MKVLWIGDSCVSTGFARCTHAACDALHAAGHEVEVLGMHHYGDPHPCPYRIWPAYQPWDGGRDLFGVSRFPLMVERHRPDLVVILQDPWNVPAYLKALESYKEKREEQGAVDVPDPLVIGWLAVDAKNQKGAELNDLDHVITWTRFASEELQRGGYEGEPSVVPLGVDTEVYRPLGDRSKARRAATGGAIPDEAFIVGTVGRNQPRKRLDLLIDYFGEWVHRRHRDDAYLMLHVAPTGEKSCDLRSLIRFHGLGGRVILREPHVGMGEQQEAMPLVYGAMDVYATTTQGEGWGLPVLEAMACGVPCIVPRWSALGDWAHEAAVQVGCSTTALNSPMNESPYTVGGVPDRKMFIRELDSLYESEPHREAHSKRGLALARRYTWDRTGRELVRELEKVMEIEAASRELRAAEAAG